MKYAEGIFATSHIDRHGDKLTINALTSMVTQINSQYLPIIVEHDPRCPPQGRTISAQLEQLEDGEYAVKATSQLFEKGDNIEFDNTGRKMPIREVNDEFIHIIDDRSFATPDDQVSIEELRQIISGKKDTEEKKALDPISVLQIAGIFILGGIATGFINKIGADCWDAFKRKLSEIIQKKKEERSECLLIFRFLLKHQQNTISIEVILTNPSNTDIDLFLKEGLQDLDKLSPYLLSNKNISKIVLEYSKGKLAVSFGVRSDAVPMYFHLNT
jgi:hypothetical protein